MFLRSNTTLSENTSCPACYALEATGALWSYLSTSFLDNPGFIDRSCDRVVQSTRCPSPSSNRIRPVTPGQGTCSPASPVRPSSVQTSRREKETVSVSLRLRSNTVCQLLRAGKNKNLDLAQPRNRC